MAAAAVGLVALCLLFYFLFYRHQQNPRIEFTKVTTLAGLNGEFGEPFGVAAKNGEIYISDGESGKIWRRSNDGKLSIFAENLHTPSAIAFDKNGDIIVADSGSHAIKRVDKSGAVSIVAGIENQPGDMDGDALSARFNAPIGLAVRQDGAIIVADTYNDKIKIIRDGTVTTLAGSNRGFAEGKDAQFDTPCGVAIWKDGRVIVADSGNKRLRMVEANGVVWTLAGSGESEYIDGLLTSAAFVRPMAVTVSGTGEVFVADNHAVRAIRNRSFAIVETLSRARAGFTDGAPHASAFNRVSGLTLDEAQNLIVADSDNGAIRGFSTDASNTESLLPIKHSVKTDSSEFRGLQPGRWPYDPPEAKRDIAGTLGEIRGEIVDDKSQARFHNGLDIAGNYGETAYFIRDEKVLLPIAAENFGTSRELLRMPTLGYIHLRLGRDSSDKPFADSRFQFTSSAEGKLDDVRIPRGAKFKAGEAIGTLNSMNHVHLIAGPSGDEMNALDALIFPDIFDSIAPTIENIAFFDEGWREFETAASNRRIKLSGKTRIVVRAYDRVDGNAERRRLGVYRLGFQILRQDKTPFADPNWNISFDRNPDAAAVSFTYAKGSRSGATGETIFNYIVTNHINGDNFREGFFDTQALNNDIYTLRVFAADFFGNISSKDISIEVTK